MNWCFAIINGKLGEIYFEKTKNGQIKFLGHSCPGPAYPAEWNCAAVQEKII